MLIPKNKNSSELCVFVNEYHEIDRTSLGYASKQFELLASSKNPPYIFPSIASEAFTCFNMTEPTKMETPYSISRIYFRSKIDKIIRDASSISKKEVIEILEQKIKQIKEL